MTRRKATVLGQIALLAVVCMGFVLIAIYPHRPASSLGWLVLATSSVPLVLGLQYFGAQVLEGKAMAGMGRLLRVGLAVLFLLAVAVLLAATWKWITPYLTTW